MPQILKPAVTNALIELLKPIQDEYLRTQEWIDIEKKAYPPPEIKKKEKKVKDRGSRFPGAAKEVEAKADGHVEGKAKDQVDLAADAEDAMRKLDVRTNGAGLSRLT
jgi:tyrosyl-tRNA synthetase